MSPSGALPMHNPVTCKPVLPKGRSSNGAGVLCDMVMLFSSKILLVTTRILLSWRCNQFTPISPSLSRVSRVPKDECGCKDQRSSTHYLHYREEPAGPEVAMTDRCNEYEFKRNHNVGCQQRGVDIWHQERKCM